MVVPTHRRPDLLRRCLAALAGQQTPAEAFEVVVVDDASGDGTPDVLAESAAAMPNLRWASLPRNAGPATARNHGVAMARGPVVLFIDDDIVATPSLVGTHLRLHEAGSDNLGVVGLVEWHPDLPVTPFMTWLDGTDLQFAFGNGLAPGPVDPPQRAFYTCNLSLRRPAFDAAGGFDERFPHPAYEDVELGWRLGRRGLRLEYRPEALAWHARAVTLSDFCARMAMVAESAVLLRRSHPEVPVEVEAPPGGPWQSLLRHVLRPVAQRRQTVAGRDVRSRYYWAEIHYAQLTGLRRAGFADLVPGQRR